MSPESQALRSDPLGPDEVVGADAKGEIELFDSGEEAFVVSLAAPWAAAADP